ncbi:homeobox-like domain superfamily [Holotrichia oblita]|uniref:Homeobox-like domain superfamily n=1 Tax=Holotrichia oblita TaxID=644536 RepID=A0ACB9TN87_HOLOL|nr:homeobox-like domain superfamily [Holotrichia oblita]
MPLTVVDASQIVALLEDGRSQRYVSQHLGIPHTTVQDAWNRFLETDTFVRRVGSERRRATTTVDDRFIVLNTLRDRRSTAVQLQHRLLAVVFLPVSL